MSGSNTSGSSAALQDMITQMTYGGRIAMLGLPSSEISADFAVVVLKMLTIKGIYGREMYETWYEMSVLLESGLDISGGSPASLHRLRESSSVARGPRREGDHELG